MIGGDVVEHDVTRKSMHEFIDEAHHKSMIDDVYKETTYIVNEEPNTIQK